MKYKVALIGGGNITTHYTKGLNNSKTLEVVCLIDKNENCPGRSCFANIPFYIDYAETFDLDIDFYIVSASTDTHYEILKCLLLRGKNVFVEKPLVTNEIEFEELYELAKINDVLLECMYHWCYAEEIKFMKAMFQKEILVRKAKISIFDNYACSNNRITNQHLGLMGAWFDSGINVLSLLYELFPHENIRLGEKTIWEEDLVCNLPVHIVQTLWVGDIPIEIEIDWTKESRKKYSQWDLENGKIHVDHNNQRIILQKVFQNDRENTRITTYVFPCNDRLDSHYQNMFEYMAPNPDNETKSKVIHKLLFSVAKS